MLARRHLQSTTRFVTISALVMPTLWFATARGTADEPGAREPEKNLTDDDARSQDVAGTDSQDVAGTWVRHQNTPSGRVTFVKTHRGNDTLLTAYDKDKNVLYAHASTFNIESSGKFRILTFSNRRITAGPNAGAADRKPVSFVYRIVDDRFIEVYGLIDGDDSQPNMLIWERSKSEPKPAGL